MSFKLPDLIVESVLRDGFRNIRRDPSIIDDIFCDLTKPFAAKKYGEKELNKIKDIFINREVSIIHSYNLANTELPCISIQLADDREKENQSFMGNYLKTEVRQLNDAEKAKLIIINSFQPVSYDAKTGIVVVDDSVNLSTIHVNLLFVDTAGAEHVIIGGIVNEDGRKQFMIPRDETVDLGANAQIKSSLDYKVYQANGNIESVQIILGLHTKEALLTKYLYTIVKYIMLSRRKDLITRGLNLNTYNGSDFHRNMEYVGDVVYTRFFNIGGMQVNDFRFDKVQLIDNVDVNIKVPKDRLGNDALNRTTQTIQVKE